MSLLAQATSGNNRYHHCSKSLQSNHLQTALTNTLNYDTGCSSLNRVFFHRVPAALAPPLVAIGSRHSQPTNQIAHANTTRQPACLAAGVGELPGLT